MELERDQLRRIARLARIEVAEGDLDKLSPELAGIFGMIEQLQAVDTSGLAPMAHPLSAIGDMALRLRDDVVTEADAREANMANAPEQENGLFLVPRVIE
jgi:aspartyl-tRNA(Asn)/glutamyl-tRNA(Gln) amidotransferase subunit C